MVLEPVEPPLPDGWVWTTLGKTGQLLRGVSYRKEDASEQPKNDFVPILRATNIQDEKLVLASNLVYVPSRYVKVEQYLEPGDIVVCMSSGSKGLVGKTAQLVQEWTGSFGTFCATIRPYSAVNPKYLGYFFTSPEYRQFIREKSAGININNLKPSDFETLDIPLPPMPEQERIVRRLEELLSDLEAGVAALEHARLGVKRYKASVLKAACEGKLFGDKEIEDGVLPEGWRLERLVNSTIKITDGTHFTPTYIDAGIAFISVKDIYGGQIHFEKCRLIPQEEHDQLIKRCHPEPMDVLITKSGTIGRIAVVNTDRPFSLFVSVALIKPLQEVWNSNYLAAALGNYIAHLDIQQDVKGGVIKNLHIEDIKEIQLPLPPLEEQRRIVAELERRLESARGVESADEAGLKRAGRLRQAVLRSAFEGRL